MNKYSSKAIKTAATVGMSLAMVLSAMPAVGNATVAQAAVCASESINFVAKLVKEVPDLSSVNADTEFDLNGNDENLFGYVKANKGTFEDVANCYTSKDEYQEYAEKLVKMINAIEKLTEETNWSDIDKNLTEDDYKGKVSLAGIANAIANGNSWVNAYIDGALAYSDFLNGFEYADNLTSSQRDLYEDTMYELNGQLEDIGYTSENKLDAYVTKLEDDLDKFIKESASKTLNGVKVNIAANTSSKSIIEAKIKAIKAESNYKLFRDNAAVEAIIEQYEAMLDEVAEVAEATNSKKNDAYAAYIKKSDGKSAMTRIADLEGLKGIKAGIKLADWELLKDFKEEVVDTVWVFETKQYGDYYVNKSDATAYVTDGTLGKVLKDFNYELVTNFDREEGTFGWDELSAHMTKVQENLKALTDGIKGLDAINVTANDKEAIMAADDALYFFDDKGTDNLTSAQKRDVKNAERKVSELMEAYRSKFGSLNVTTGWVDAGNGNWKFYETDGTAPTKWVASGSDWYYVKNGVMLRNSWIASDSKGTKWYYVDDAGKMVSNTTVNGYTFNSYGVWVK